MSRRERVKPASKFGVYFEVCNFVGRGWEMQEGLAVEPLLLGCGLKACDLKRLKQQPKQINPECSINPFQPKKINPGCPINPKQKQKQKQKPKPKPKPKPINPPQKN